MNDLYFNDKRFVGYSKISDVFFLLPAIMWYMERERIKDADSLVICVHWLCFQVNLEAKRLCLVRHQADSPVNLVLLQLRKGGKPGLKWEEIVLHDLSGAPTEQYRRIYHL